MPKFQWSWRILLLSVACAAAPAWGERSILMSSDEEAEAGAKAAQQVEEVIGFVSDEDLVAYVEDIGARLAKFSPRIEVKYRFYVVEMMEPNAFALPGGYIYVSRGLIALTNSEAELANVLAHEVAHVALRHAAYREAQAKKATFLTYAGILAAALMGGGGAAAAAAAFSQAAGAGLIASYSRDQEREADRLGQDIALKAGWDPRAMATFLRTLDQHTRIEYGSTRLPGFFDTHPGTVERVATAATLSEHVASPQHAGIESTRAAYLRRIEGLLIGPNPSEGMFRGSQFVHPDLDFSLRFPSEWQTANEKAAIRAISPRRDAMLVLEIQGPGDDPTAAAQAYAEQNEERLERGKFLRIAGLPAYQARTRVHSGQGDFKAQIVWLAYGDLIYRLTGMAKPGRLVIRQADFARVARSFRPLSATEKDSLRQVRLKVAEARADESFEQISGRTGNVWTPTQTAVFNALPLGSTLREGVQVKVAASRAYIPPPKER